MYLEVDAAARREALRVKQNPDDPALLRRSGMLGSLALNEATKTDLVVARTESIKPATFGLLGVYVEQSVVAFLEHRPERGPFGLLRKTRDGVRPAKPQDFNDWWGLETCWEDTLDHDIAAVLAAESESATLEALESLWELRKLAMGTDISLLTHMQGGGGQSARQFTTGAYGMNNFQKRHGNRDRDSRLQVLRHSPTPYINTADLEAGQLHALNERYNGEHTNRRGVTNLMFGAIDDSVYRYSASGSLVYRDAIERLPLYGDVTVGTAPSDPAGPRIGCPILLSPKLLQMMWAAYVDTLEQTRLV